MLLLGRTLNLVGKVMIAYMAVRVHSRFRHEKKIDKVVFLEMKKEQALGFFGMFLIILGYVFEVYPELISFFSL